MKRCFNQVDKHTWSLRDYLRSYLKTEEATDIISGFYLFKFINDSKNDYEWNIPDEVQFEYLRNIKHRIKDGILQAVEILEKENHELENIFSKLLFRKIELIPDDLIYHIILEMSSLDLSDENIAGYVASKLIEKRFENTTSDSIKNLAVNILRPYKGKAADWFIGTGGYFIEINKQLKKENINPKNISYYGQEINEEVYLYCKFNLIMNGMINYSNIKLGNSIVNPLFVEDDNNKLMKFDYIVSSPPFGMLKWGNDEIKYDKYRRFIYGTPGKNSFDWASIQHILTTLNNTGKASVLVSEGTLFRSAESDIRGKIIQDDLIEAVISLPSNMMPNTSIPVYLIIFNKDKEEDKKGKIQFIDASKEFERGRRLNTLTKETILRIVEVYEKGMEIEGYSYFLNVNQLREYSWDLNAFKYLEVEMFKETLNNMIQLKDVALKIRRGVQLPKSKLDKLNKSKNKTHYLINLADITEEGTVIYSEDTKIEPEKKWIDLYEIEEGDLIISSRGTLTKIAIVGKDVKPAILSGNLLLVRLNSNKYNVNVLKFYLESPVGQKLLEGLKIGTTVSVISPKSFEELLIPKIDSNIDDIAEAIKDNKGEYVEALKLAKERYENKKKMLYNKIGIGNIL